MYSITCIFILLSHYSILLSHVISSFHLLSSGVSSINGILSNLESCINLSKKLCQSILYQCCRGGQHGCLMLFRIIQVHTTEVVESDFFIKFIKYFIIFIDNIVTSGIGMAGIETNTYPVLIVYPINDIFQLPEFAS